MDRFDYTALCSASSSDLEVVMRSGTPPDIDALAGYEYRGWNNEFFASWAGILRFKKGFFRDPRAGGRVRGYNKPIVQGGGLVEPWTEKGRDGRAKPFGFYEVEPPNGGRYPNSVLLNYGCPRNFPIDPTKLLRDYVVEVEPGNPDLLLGKAYLAIPPRWPHVSWFILERLGPSEVPA
jgi:hypothetical protein